jgi:hypothetical protein
MLNPGNTARNNIRWFMCDRELKPIAVAAAILQMNPAWSKDYTTADRKLRRIVSGSTRLTVHDAVLIAHAMDMHPAVLLFTPAAQRSHIHNKEAQRHAS